MGLYGGVKSVSEVIRRSVLLMLLLTAFIALGALFTLFYSVPDAKAINLAGSLKAQAYRMAYQVTQQQPIDGQITEFETTLQASVLVQTQQWITPAQLRHTYGAMQEQWRHIKGHWQIGDEVRSVAALQSFIDTIDAFIIQMQYHVEFKVKMLALAEIIGLLLILLTAIFIIRFTQWHIVAPLNQLVLCAREIEHQAFSNLTFPADCHNELGVLSDTIESMAAQLAKTYSQLEEQVAEKNIKIKEANKALSFLYSTAHMLHTASLSDETFIKLLNKAAIYQQLDYIRLVREESGFDVITTGHSGWPEALVPTWVLPLELNEWQCGRLEMVGSHLDRRLMGNFTLLLTHVLHKDHSVLQQQRLLLMEERAIIARELHDSLAQSLSYLKIQAKLLQRTFKDEKIAQAVLILDKMDVGLSSAYTQLRQLLGTFRLTLGDANLRDAISSMLEPLTEQTTSKLEFEYELPAHLLDAGQHIHLLQLIREAVLNAIKHAQATTISVKCGMQSDGLLYIAIIDDGLGIGDSCSALNHYGLSIMRERASKLFGTLTIADRIPVGTAVHLVFPPVSN